MEYQGYTASVEFDSDAEVFHGRVLNIRDIVTFEGTSVGELQEEFRASVDDYLAFCTERGEEPERPYSGRLALRMTSELHSSIARCAVRMNQSINSWIVDQLQERTAVLTQDGFDREKQKVLSSED